MTNISSGQADFDFWEFVSCAKCQLSFSQETIVPFWLTECGHVICNNHLNPDQSCSQCGLQGIQLAPLQQEMEASMSDWFCSIPMTLNSIAFTAKFQQETMASQVRHFKTRDQQLRHFVDRLKRDIAELKKTNGVLQSEIDQLRMQMDQSRDGQTPSNTFNSNRKRQMSTHQSEFSSRRPMTNSSPRSIPTPLGPNRLTLAPGQQISELSSREQHNPGLTRSHAYGQENQGHFVTTLQPRPISSRSFEQYAYMPTDTLKSQVQQMSYPNAGSKTFQNTNQLQSAVPQQGKTQGLPAMLPPTSRFTPTLGSNTQFNLSKGIGPTFPRQTNMGPPPTPQRFRPVKSQLTNHLVPPSSRRQNTDTATPSTSHQLEQPPNATSQKFFQTSSTPSNPRGPSSRPGPNTMRGEHRIPFVPEGAAGLL